MFGINNIELLLGCIILTIGASSYKESRTRFSFIRNKFRKILVYKIDL